MKNLIKHIQNINARYNLWVNADTLILAVSGGPDSMCLLNVMNNIAKKTNLNLIVGHINYGLRGIDSNNDQKLVEETCKQLNIVCEVLKCKQNSGSNENDWRKIRYEFFQKISKKYNADNIVVAHNKNDQAETLLLHLLRGSGLRGLSGMKIKSDNIIRPMLGVQKDDILQYCKNYNIKYNLDKTNENTDFTRNKVRNELIPYLEKNFNKQIINNLANTASNIALDYDLLNMNQEYFWDFDEKNKIISFEVESFLQKHPAEQKMALRTMIEQLKGNIINIENGLIDEFIKVILSTKNKHQKIVTKDLKMRRKGGTVELVHI